MKKHFTKSFTILLVVVLTLIVASGAMAGTKKGFDGAWEAIDVDDSYMVMTINSGNSYFMMYDFGASVCGLDEFEDPLFSWSFEGPPVIVGNVLTVEGLHLCFDDDPNYMPEGNPQTIVFELTFNKISDTIYLQYSGGGEVTWSRIGKK